MLSLAYIAIAILAIALILIISSKIIWLVFLLFCYRTIANIFPYESFANLGPDNHLMYFFIILLITVALYAVLLKFTRDIEWVRHITIFGLAIYCLFNYSISELLFFRDYFDAVDLWNWQWYKDQLADIYKNPTVFPDMLLAFLNDIIQTIVTFFNGYIKS